jgi:hypothetical protein
MLPTTVTAIRQLLFPLWYVGVRLGNRAGRIVLAGIGIAAGAAMLAAVLAGALVAQHRSLAHALERVPPGERALRAAWFGVPVQAADYSTLDRAVRRALGPLVAREPIGVMQYRQTRIAGHLVDLGAVDGLREWVRLRSGRLPRPCRPERCEVLQLGGSGTIPNVLGLRLVRVGRATLMSQVPFGRFAPLPMYRAQVVGARFASRTPPPPFLVAEGVSGLARAPELESIHRSYAWVVPIEPGAVPPWRVDEFAARVERALSELKTASWGRSELNSTASLFDLTAPVTALEEAADAGRVSGRRLLLVGGEAVALLLAFAVLAAAGMRRSLGSALRRMTWFGASRWQLILSAIAEAAAVAVVATAVGWALGAGFALVLAERGGSPARGTILHSVVSATGLAAAAALAGAATLALLVTLGARGVRLGALSFSLVDAAALGALAAVAVGLARGEADPRALTAEEGTGAFLILLPGLIAFVGGVALARALGPGLRLLERLVRHSAPSVRLAALSLARRPGHAAITVGFLAVSLALALFAATYRSTLARGQGDQARFAVPLDFVLREDPVKLVRPLEAAPLSRYRVLGPDVATVPVLRLSGSVSRVTRRGVTLLGLPATALARLPGWRSDFAAPPPSELARRISPQGALELRGARIPDDARELELPLSALGDDVMIAASVETPRGDFVHVELGETAGSKRHLLDSDLPEGARGGRIVALTLGLTTLSSETGEPLEGRLALGRLRTRSADGRTTGLTDYGGWVGVNGVEVESGGGETSLRYFVTKQASSRFRPRQPTDGRAVAVVASPRIARAAGSDAVLPVQLLGQQLPARVVAVARRFPSIEGDFVIADDRTLSTALNTEAPGTAVMNEVWLGAPPGRLAEVEAALRRPPFSLLRLESRSALEANLRNDPLARSALLTLVASAVVALALALVGLVLSLVADLKDERGELFDLEAEGAEPASLSRHLRLRAAFTLAIGLVGGLGLGSLLSTVVLDLVALTANAEVPEPPLLLEFAWPLVALIAVGYLALAAVLVVGLTWTAFRSPTPARPPVGAA